MDKKEKDLTINLDQSDIPEAQEIENKLMIKRSDFDKMNNIIQNSDLSIEKDEFDKKSDKAKIGLMPKEPFDFYGLILLNKKNHQMVNKFLIENGVFFFNETNNKFIFMIRSQSDLDRSMLMEKYSKISGVKLMKTLDSENNWIYNAIVKGIYIPEKNKIKHLLSPMKKNENIWLFENNKGELVIVYLGINKDKINEEYKNKIQFLDENGFENLELSNLYETLHLGKFKIINNPIRSAKDCFNCDQTDYGKSSHEFYAIHYLNGKATTSLLNELKKDKIKYFYIKGKTALVFSIKTDNKVKYMDLTQKYSESEYDVYQISKEQFEEDLSTE